MKNSNSLIVAILPFFLAACGGGGNTKQEPNSSINIPAPIVEPLKSNNLILGLQEPYTLVSMAPSIIQIASLEQSLAPNSVYASQLYYDLDSNLNLIDPTGKVVSSLQSLVTTSQGKFLIVAKIKDQQTIQALATLSKTVDLKDTAFITENSDFLKSIHNLMPNLRTGLDLRKETYLTDQAKDLLSIVQRTNQSFSRFVILPQNLNSKNNVSYIQRLLVSVWVESDNSPQAAAEALITGANGIITQDSKVISQILQQFPANTLLRKPLVIGHRGVPVFEDENTLEGAKRAVSLGADIVENDIFITKDNHLVIMHDSTVDRTTNGSGPIENMTLEEVKKLSTKTKGYKVPTLEEYFQAFKSNKNMVHFIELKSTNPLIVPRLKEEIAANAVEDQVVTISFYTDQISKMKAILPGISTGYLTGTPNLSDQKENVKKMLEITQSLSVTFNPGYADNLMQLMEATKHRSITVWPWTIDDENLFKKLYIAGVYGITTDNAQYAAKYVVEIQTQSSFTVNKDENLKLTVQLKTQDGSILTDMANQLIILNGAPKYESKNGSIQFKESGTAYVLPGYKYQIDQQNAYTIFTSPVKVVVK